MLLKIISCTMLTFLASSCTTNSKASFILSKANSVAFIFLLKVSLHSFTFPFFEGSEAFLHHWFGAFHVLHVFSDWQSLLPLALYSCLLLFFSQLSKPLHYGSFLENIRTYGSFPIIFHILPRYVFFLHYLSRHCTFVSVFLLLPVRKLSNHIWHKLVVYDSVTFINYHRSQLPVAEGLFAALIVTTKQRLLRNAYRARNENLLSSISSCSVLFAPLA